MALITNKNIELYMLKKHKIILHQIYCTHYFNGYISVDYRGIPISNEYPNGDFSKYKSYGGVNIFLDDFRNILIDEILYQSI